ncbi:restriction endonuclease subunit S [Dickeya dadantii]|nr:restriction endonuclease subunit S [Dickeya dadantii]
MSEVKLPQGWVETDLGSILELKYGKALPEKVRDGENYPVYGSNGIVGKHSHPLINTCGLIIGRKGSYGEVNISYGPFYPIDTTYFIEKLHNQPIRYWFYQLKRLPLTTLNRSTAIPGLNREDAYQQLIYLPSIQEQEVIAEKLDTLLLQVDSIKAHLDKIPLILKKFRQSVLAAAVSGKLTEDWRGVENPIHLRKLGELASDIRYGTSKKCSKEKGNTPVLRIPNIGMGHIIKDDLKYADFDHKELEGLSLKDGDLLLIRSNGSVELVGKVAVISKDDEKFLFAGYLIRIRLDLGKSVPHYISFCLQSPQIRQTIENIARSTSGVNNINSKELSSLELPIPSMSEQAEIVRRVEQLFAYADGVEKQVQSALERVNNLTQSILAKAFRGELTAQWREENPELISGENSAEALLARIKAERTAQQPQKKTRRKASAAG